MWNMVSALVGVLFAMAQGSLTEQERNLMADMVACPFIAAEVHHGRLTPKNGKWTRDQAKAVLNHYMPAYFGDSIWGKLGLKAFRTGLVTGLFGLTADESPMPWETLEFMHGKHTGIRLAKIVGQPDVWKQPCNKPELGNWSMDPSCGEPGPHGEVLDHYATLLGKGPNDKWSKDDLAEMCDKSADVVYVTGKAHPEGEALNSMGEDLCKSVYGGLAGVFGSITTLELRAFLTNYTYPANWEPPVSAAFLPVSLWVYWATMIMSYFQAQ